LTRRGSRAELRRLYQQEGLSTTLIAQRYGVRQQTAHGWLRAAEVPLRPAGQPARADPSHPCAVRILGVPSRTPTG
jgi:transposase-like protein